MKRVTLKRDISHDWGTTGYLTYDDFECRTLELPDKSNKRKLSCIPPGIYICKIVDSPKFGGVYEVTNVIGRGDILIHKGNWAGDIEKGFKTNSNGCILLGEFITVINGQSGCSNSKKMFDKFMGIMNGEDFELTIENKIQ
jgi:hypothetical protein